MLDATRDLAPDIYPFIHCSYSSPSHLHWGDRSIVSAEGVEQGDHLGSLLFCLTLHRYCQRLSSVLCIFYLGSAESSGCSELAYGECSGVLGPRSLLFVKELVRKLRQQTGEEKAADYLIQQLSIAVQQGNAISILGSVGSQHCP